MYYAVPNPKPYSERQIALWIGRADKTIKMPLVLIELARAIPDIQFVMVMNGFDDEVAALVNCEKPSNVTIHASVPFDEIEALYAQAFVFVNTSSFEGFPNTFLQAGKYAVPILSYIVDPDDFIEKNQCGIVAHGDFDRLVEGIKTIRADQGNARLFSENILQYVKTHHNLEDVVEQIDQAISSFLEPHRQ